MHRQLGGYFRTLPLGRRRLDEEAWQVRPFPCECELQRFGPAAPLSVALSAARVLSWSLAVDAPPPPPFVLIGHAASLTPY